MALPQIPLASREAECSVVRAAEQLRRMDVYSVLVEPDSPARQMSHKAYYIPAGLFHPDCPATVVICERDEDDGEHEARAMLRAAAHHAAHRLGLVTRTILACDDNASPCDAGDKALLRQELAAWWSWWAPLVLGDRPARREPVAVQA